jgi:outer membrane immunogenic protein
LPVGSNTTVSCNTPGVCLSGSDTKNSTGWTLGGGFEWAWTKNTTLKFEYLHVDLGDQTVRLDQQGTTGLVRVAGPMGFATAKFENSFEVVRAAINVGF